MLRDPGKRDRSGTWRAILVASVGVFEIGSDLVPKTTDHFFRDEDNAHNDSPGTHSGSRIQLAGSDAATRAAEPVFILASLPGNP